MNPLTLVKRIQSINAKEANLGISEDASWHAKYKDSAYVYVGGIPFDLTEGDLLAVFAQYGEIVDVNLVRDKGTGKSKGFAFVAYEDQRSTTLAVDNLNGAQILGRTVRVDHVSKYKKKEEEDEEEAQKKREERGVCRAFQKGECTRGAGCKFSHDEQRAANTGWGADDKPSTWGHDKYDGQQKRETHGVCRDFQKGKCTRGAGCRFLHDEQRAANRSWGADDKPSSGSHDKNEGQTKRDRRTSFKEEDFRRPSDRIDEDNRGRDRHSDRKEKGTAYDEDRDRSDKRKRSTEDEAPSTLRDGDRREERRSSRYKSESYTRVERDKRDYPSRRHRENED